MQQQSSRAAPERPLLNVVLAVPAKREGGRTRWAQLGTGYPHRSGEGFNLVLDSLPLDWSRFLVFPRTAKGEAAPAELPPLTAERFTIYVPILLNEEEAKKGANEKEILAPCGVAFPHEKGGGFTIHLNSLPKDWTRLVVLPEAVEARAQPAHEEDAA